MAKWKNGWGQFQFQNGSIKINEFKEQTKDDNQFQFQNGSIKIPKRKKIRNRNYFVSIPKWFD